MNDYGKTFRVDGKVALVGGGALGIGMESARAKFIADCGLAEFGAEFSIDGGFTAA